MIVILIRALLRNDIYMRATIVYLLNKSRVQQVASQFFDWIEVHLSTCALINHKIVEVNDKYFFSNEKISIFLEKGINFYR